MTQPHTTNKGLSLSLRQLRKSFGPRQVLSDIDLNIKPGEFVAIVGRSGCGKSTLLRLVAGLDQPSGGELLVNGQRNTALHAEARIMFQEPRLLPWQRVQDNVALGLPPEQRERALQVLAQVGLADRAQEWPAKLSGGQRQRVALARALVHRPQLLLLDEPLGALDALTRIEMHALIERLWRDHGFTALLVTHDVQEAVALADRVILIEDGVIALDERIDLLRPRSRGDAKFAALEKRILDRVLQHPDEEPSPANDVSWPGLPAHGLRWAI
jgi:sulfonate transport system ATP-binding protein